MRKIVPAIAVGVTMLSVAGATFAYAVSAKDVNLTVDGSSHEISTTVGTVGQLLDRQGIRVGPHDVVAPDPAAALSDGGSVVVRLGRQVTVTLDGVPQTFWTTATTVDQALAAERIEVDGSDRLSTSRSASIGREGLELALSTEKTVRLDDAGDTSRRTTTAATVAELLLETGVAVDGDDEVTPSLSTPLTDGAKIRYTRVDTRQVTKRSKVDFATTYRKTKKLDQGQSKVLRAGVKGKRTVVTTEVRHNGTLVSREQTSSRITTKPKNAVVLRGTKPVRSVLRGGEPADVGDGGGTRSEIFTTGYTYWDNSPPGSAQIARPILHDRAGGTGTWKDPITVAVQAGRFEFGTRFYLPELKKYFVVEDLCGACYDGRNGGAFTLDLWVDGSHLSSGGAARVRLPRHPRAARHRGSEVRPARRPRSGLLTEPGARDPRGGPPD